MDFDADSQKYCLNLVRSHDYDRFLTSLHAPAADQPLWFAILAFNMELAMIREAVSEPMLGHIRLQWWYDRLHSLMDDTSTAQGHPVLLGLQHVLKTTNITADDLTQLIPARDQYDFEQHPFENMEYAEFYCKETSGALQSVLVKLALHSQNHIATHFAVMETMAREAGTAFALLGLIRGSLFQASHGRCTLPKDLLVGQGISLDQYVNQPFGENMVPVLGTMCDRVREILRDTQHTYTSFKATKGSKELVRKAWPAFAPLVYVPHDLERIAQSQGHIEQLSFYSPLRKQLHLIRARTMRRIW